MFKDFIHNFPIIVSPTGEVQFSSVLPVPNTLCRYATFISSDSDFRVFIHKLYLALVASLSNLEDG